MKKLIITILLVIVAAVSVVASTELEKEIARCATIDEDLERLECYDRLALGLDRAQAAVEETGKWHVSVETTPVDDTTIVQLTLFAEEVHWLDRDACPCRDQVTLVLWCWRNETGVSISWPDVLASEARVTWHVGDDDAITSKWTLISSKSVTHYPYNDIEFIQRLLDADRVGASWWEPHRYLVVQVPRFLGGAITAIFDLTGLTNAIRPLQDACGWE